MAAGDAKFVPIKNQAFRVYFPILDADGDLVSGATGLDSECSLDGGTFADCTNEATEIATSSGMYFLDLTASEMNTDCTVVIVKTTTSGAKTTPIVLYTADRGIEDLAYPTVSGRSIDVATTGEVGLDFANTAGTLNDADITSVGAVTGSVTVGTNNDKTGYALSTAGIDAILDDPLTELSVVPAAAPTLRQALQFLYMALRNKITTTSSQTKIHNDAGSVIGTAAVSDDGTTFTRDEYA